MHEVLRNQEKGSGVLLGPHSRLRGFGVGAVGFWCAGAGGWAPLGRVKGHDVCRLPGDYGVPRVCGKRGQNLNKVTIGEKLAPEQH